LQREEREKPWCLTDNALPCDTPQLAAGRLHRVEIRHGLCCTDTARILLVNPPFKVLEVLFLEKFSQLFCLQRRHVGHTNFGTWGLANSIRPLCGHPPSSPILALASAQKLSPLISVELVGSQEFLDDMETGELCNRNRGMFTSRTEKSHNILYPAFVCRAQVSTIYRPISF